MITVAARVNVPLSTTDGMPGRPSCMGWQSRRSPGPLRTNPFRSFPRTNVPYPYLKGLSHLPLQRWRGPYPPGYSSRISISLCFVFHLLGSNHGSLWKGICLAWVCPSAGKRIFVRAGQITSVNSVGKLMSVHLSNYRRLIMVSVLLSHSIARRHLSCRMLGAFGVASLVRERTIGKLFAMKQVRVSLAERHFSLSALFVCPVTQDGYAEEGPGGLRSFRA
jgi:hypothetical protein